MIPTNGVIENAVKIEYSNTTYGIDFVNKVVKSNIDNIEALKQSIYIMLNVERYDYLIYNYNYGIELKNLFGKDMQLVCSVLERRIRDCLSIDNRISNLSDFEFTIYRNTLKVTFTVSSIFGKHEQEVKINV
mgnify:FL=1|jgi:hypothetical protein